MRLRDFWMTALRRWYFVLLAIAISAAATVLVVVRVGPTYTAQGAALVFPPATSAQRDGGVQTVGNPYLNLQGVTLARDIVIRALTSNSTTDELAERFPSSTFEATPDYVNSAPIILVSVEAGSPEEASTLLSTIMQRIPTILTDLQSGLGLQDDALITSKALIADSVPEPAYKDQIRAGIIALVAALGLSLLVIGMVDSLLAGRRNAPTQRAGDRMNRSAGISDKPDQRTPPAVPDPGAASATPRRLGMRANPAGGASGRQRSVESRAESRPNEGEFKARSSVGVDGSR